MAQRVAFWTHSSSKSSLLVLERLFADTDRRQEAAERLDVWCEVWSVCLYYTVEAFTSKLRQQGPLLHGVWAEVKVQG